MHCEEKIAWLEAKRGKNHSIEQIEKTLHESVPEIFAVPSIQILGTNGKGSTLTWLSLLLQKQGLSVGTFTSPHLVTHFERIAFNGKPIEAAEWEEIFDRWQPYFEEENCSMFEADLIMAANWFARKKPGVILWEAGMGGERDATSALPAAYRLLCNAGLDHMAYLGNTVEEIAATKARAIRPGEILISTERKEGPLKVMEEVCRKRDAAFVPAKTFEKYLEEISGDNCVLWPDRLPLYQKENLALALAALKQMDRLPASDQLEQVMEEFSWAGRFMCLRKDPLVLLDGAHNEPGVEALCASLGDLEKPVDRVYFSVLGDKQADAMIEMLKGTVKDLVLVSFDCYRLADLQTLAQKHNLKIIGLDEALEEIKKTGKRVLLTGSLYFAGEILKRMEIRPV